MHFFGESQGQKYRRSGKYLFAICNIACASRHRAGIGHGGGSAGSSHWRRPGDTYQYRQQRCSTEHTDARGEYQFVSIKIGKYTLTAEASGFGKATQTDVVVNIQQSVLANLTLKPGSVQSTVEVTTAPAQLQTEDASVGKCGCGENHQ